MKEQEILLIEDDPDHAELIIDMLGVEGVKKKVVLLRDGQEALDYLHHEIQSQVDLILLDLNLPRVHGMDVLKFVKKSSKYHKIPVIILSTSSDQKTIDEAYKNGADDYFIKPSSYEGIVEKARILKEYVLKEN